VLDWGKVRTFLWGGMVGGLLGLLLAPRRRRHVLLNAMSPQALEGHLFSSAPCYSPDDQFT
jgi:hypothetical protein